MTLIEKADALAAQAHQGQTRKGAPLPYIVHPRAVADMLAHYGFSDATVAAALVHDVVEDTTMGRDVLLRELGEEVVSIVDSVTEDKSLPWEERKLRYIAQVRAGSPEAKALSVADKIHNIQSVLALHKELGDGVWEIFNRGKEKKLWFERSMLHMLKETYQHPMVDEYAVLVDEFAALP